MEKTTTILMFYFFLHVILISTINGETIPKGPKAVRQWFKDLPTFKEKVIELHFYFHDTVTGKNPSAITITQANFTLTSPTKFGMIRMMDNDLTVGPDADSKIIGRAQGIYGSYSFEEIQFLMTLNLVFTEGKYNGSTLSVLGHNPIFNKYREMPIVGGSGVFRLARGIATARTVWVNMTTENAVVEYNVVVLYYESK